MRTSAPRTRWPSTPRALTPCAPTPKPVQVAGVNDRVFLVNASLGLYPDLLEDREAYKARFGRSRWVAFVAGCATLLRAQPLRMTAAMLGPSLIRHAAASSGAQLKPICTAWMTAAIPTRLPVCI